MKLLIITPNIPFPLSEGGKVAQFAVLDAIRADVDVTLILFCYSESENESISQLKIKWSNVDIIVRDERRGEIKSATNYLRKIYNKLDKLSGSKGTDGSVSEGANDKYLTELEDSKYMYSTKSDDTVQFITNCIEQKKPDIVQVDLLAFIDLVHAIPQNYKKVFVHQEIRFERIHTLLKTRKKVTAYETYIYEHVKNIELSLLDFYDGVIVYSDDDKKKLNRFLKNASILSNGFPVPDDSFKVIDKKDLKITKLVFLGGENHYPNVDAVDWYANEIAGKVVANFDLCLHVIGNWTAKTIQEKSQHGHVKFIGFVDDVADYCRNSIMLVPVRMGSGIRTKILYAMAQGTPIVTATIGCEGIVGKDLEHFLIADSPEAFINAIGKLTTDQEYTHQMVIKAQHIAENFYSQKVAAAVRLKYFKEIAGLL